MKGGGKEGREEGAEGRREGDEGLVAACPQVWRVPACSALTLSQCIPSSIQQTTVEFLDARYSDGEGKHTDWVWCGHGSQLPLLSVF